MVDKVPERNEPSLKSPCFLLYIQKFLFFLSSFSQGSLFVDSSHPSIPPTPSISLLFVHSPQGLETLQAQWDHEEIIIFILV